jgi:hypothetical protein
MLSNCGQLFASSDQDDVTAMLLQSPTDDSAHRTSTIDHKSHKSIITFLTIDFQPGEVGLFMDSRFSGRFIGWLGPEGYGTWLAAL